MFGLFDRLMKEAAVIEGAPISFSVACLLAFAMCWLAFRQRLAFLKETVSDYRERLEAIAPAQLAKSIKIIAPTVGARVGSEIYVRGTVRPRGSTVQVLVLSGDGLWHPQDRASNEGATWNARCWIGRSDALRRTSFQLVAIDGDRSIHEPIAQLSPDVARSRVVTVYRN